MCIKKKCAVKYIFNPFSGNMTYTPLIITTCCLLVFSCCWKHCLGMFMHPARADVLPTATDNTAASPGKDYHGVVLKEAGGSLYAIALEAYQKANETLCDLLLQANPDITDVRRIRTALAVEYQRAVHLVQRGRARTADVDGVAASSRFDR